MVPLKDEVTEDMLYSVLHQQGFTPVSSLSHDGDGLAIIIVLKEGYVVARMWQELKYCGFDIHIWGGFEKSNILYAPLASAVRSATLSSYRIVAGGMHGSSTLSEDQEVIGVQVSDQCISCEEEDWSERDEITQDILDMALNKTIDLLSSRRLVVAVACSFEYKDNCPSLKVVESHDERASRRSWWKDDSNETNNNKHPISVSQMSHTND